MLKGIWLGVFLLLLLLFTGCNKTSKETAKIPRPVKITTLELISPEKILQITGISSPWREEELAFEINGRLERIVYEGLRVEPLSDVLDGKIVMRGQELAVLDSERYQANLDIAQAELKSLQIEIAKIVPETIRGLQAKVDSSQIMVEKVLLADKKKTIADKRSADEDLRRDRQQYQEGVISDREIEQAVTRQQSMNAAYERIIASIDSQSKELEAARAELAKMEASLDSKKAQLGVATAKVTLARKDVESCVLENPFPGVVSEVYATKGAIVGPSEPVLKLTMMDPILVEVAVSSETARNLRIGDPVKAYLAEGKTIQGWVMNKALSADVSTRTYKIECNFRNRPTFDQKNKTLDQYDVSKIYQVEDKHVVPTDCIQKTMEGSFVWYLASGTTPNRKIFQKEKVAVGQRVKREGRTYSFVSSSKLKAGMLLSRKFQGVQSGDEILYFPRCTGTDLAIVLIEDQTSLMVSTSSIRQDKKGYFAWVLQGFHLGKEKLTDLKLPIEKVYFDLGSGVKNFVREDFREILNPQKSITGSITLKSNFDGLEGGMKVSLLTSDWLIHPGDLVPISFNLGNYLEGVYVPIDTIQEDNTGHYIFIHEKQKAKRIDVIVHEHFQDRRRIEPKEKISLKGKDLIVFGAHYVLDGEEINPQKLEVK